MEERVEKIVLNDSRKDELEDILFGDRDSGVSKGSVITTADSSNFKVRIKDLIKRTKFLGTRKDKYPYK